SSLARSACRRTSALGCGRSQWHRRVHYPSTSVQPEGFESQPRLPQPQSTGRRRGSFVLLAYRGREPQCECERTLPKEYLNAAENMCLSTHPRSKLQARFHAEQQRESLHLPSATSCRSLLHTVWWRSPA